MAEQGKSGSAVHLSLDQLRFVVDAFGAAVVICPGEGGIHGGAVSFETAGEGVQVGQVLGLRGGDPRAELLGVPLGGPQRTLSPIFLGS